MAGDQELLERPQIQSAQSNHASTSATMAMTFFSVAFALLSLYIPLGYTGLFAMAGWFPESLAKLFTSVSYGKAQFVAFGVCIVAGLAVAAYRHIKHSAPTAAWEKLDYWTTAIIRYFLAFMFLLYGVAKIFHGQFSTYPSVLDRPLSDVSGFSLAWYFFGYSYAYTCFIGSSEILGAILLFFRRTTTLAAMILLPVLSNIVFVNFAFSISVKTYSTIFLMMVVFLLAQDARRIKALVWDNRPFGKPAFPTIRKGSALISVKYVVVAILVVGTVAWACRLRAIGARTTTPLVGAWTVLSYEVNGKVISQSNSSTWTRFYVDSNSQAGIRRGEERITTYFSSFNSAKDTIELNARRSAKETFFQGSYHLQPDGKLMITGHDAKGTSVEVTLARVKKRH